MRFEGRHVYVTGATGFIGGRVVDRLLQEGAEVTALVRRLERAGDLGARGVQIHQGNVTDPASLRIPKGTDLVLHAAAWVEFAVPPARHELYWRTNVEGTRNVLDAARRADVPKVVHVSSVAAIGHTREDRDADEGAFRLEGEVSDDDAFGVAGRPEEPRRYHSLYEETKAVAHQAALDAGIPAAIPMPGIVLGPGGPFEPIFRAFAHERLLALPKPAAPKPWVHIDDVTDGILLAALKGEGPYLLVSENLNVTELFARLQHLADVEAPRRRVPLGLLHALATAVEKGYHLAGRTPPVSRELIDSLREPMRFTSARARKGLGWEDRFWDHLQSDLRALKETGKRSRT